MNEGRLDEATLHALIDGTLPDAERDAAMALATANGPASVAYREYVAIKATLGALECGSDHRSAWKACVGRLNELDRSRKTERFVAKYAWGLCGGFFVLIAAGGALNRMGSRSLGAADVTRMASSLIPFSHQDNPGSKWLQDNIGTMPMRRDDAIHVLSAETGEADGQRMARLNLADLYGSMVLLVIPSSTPINGLTAVPGTPYGCGRMGRSNCLAWNQDGYSMMLVGDRAVEQLEGVAQALGNAKINIAG